MRYIFLVASLIFSTLVSSAQTAPGPEERKLNNAICECITNLDFSTLTTKASANNAFMDCFSKQSGMLMKVAAERKVEITDKPAMTALGINIGKQLLADNCEAFLKLAMLMNGTFETKGRESSAGILKRIDTKDFNYLILSDGENKETSFLWFRQFPDSQQLINTPAKYLGKNVVIEWQEVEVFIPSAKNYYKIKEVVKLRIQN